MQIRTMSVVVGVLVVFWVQTLTLRTVALTQPFSLFLFAASERTTSRIVVAAHLWPTVTHLTLTPVLPLSLDLPLSLCVFGLLGPLQRGGDHLSCWRWHRRPSPSSSLHRSLSLSHPFSISIFVLVYRGAVERNPRRTPLFRCSLFAKKGGLRPLSFCFSFGLVSLAKPSSV